MYGKGDGVKRDIVKTNELWTSKAASQGPAEAVNLLKRFE
jgi:TPR repeat protein